MADRGEGDLEEKEEHAAYLLRKLQRTVWKHPRRTTTPPPPSAGAAGTTPAHRPNLPPLVCTNVTSIYSKFLINTQTPRAGLNLSEQGISSLYHSHCSYLPFKMKRRRKTFDLSLNI